MYRCLDGFPVCTTSSQCHLLLKFSVMQRWQDLIQETAMLWQLHLTAPSARGPQLINYWSKHLGFLLESRRCRIIVNRALAYSGEWTGSADEMLKMKRQKWSFLRKHDRVCKAGCECRCAISVCVCSKHRLVLRLHGIPKTVQDPASWGFGPSMS